MALAFGGPCLPDPLLHIPTNLEHPLAKPGAPLAKPGSSPATGMKKSADFSMWSIYLFELLC